MTNCNHARYRTAQYMPLVDAMKDPTICYYGIVVKVCQDCGGDVSRFRWVEAKTAKGYIG